jgi:hypothetical protein
MFRALQREVVKMCLALAMISLPTFYMRKLGPGIVLQVDYRSKRFE